MTGSMLHRIFWCAMAVAALAGCAVTPSSQTPAGSASEPLPLADSEPADIEPLTEPEPDPETIAKARTHPLIERALGVLGTRYRYGGNSPETGFDCSGFVRWIYQDIAAALPRSANALAQVDAPDIVRDALHPADLLFFRINRKRSISHVGMYLGNGQFVHSPSSGGKVRVDSMDAPYWRARFVKARRWDRLLSTEKAVVASPVEPGA
jgi:cell wall-associated NlpC family hydrolase